MNIIKNKITRVRYYYYKGFAWRSVAMMGKHLTDTDKAKFMKWAGKGVDSIDKMIKYSRI